MMALGGLTKHIVRRAVRDSGGFILERSKRSAVFKGGITPSRRGREEGHGEA